MDPFPAYTLAQHTPLAQLLSGHTKSVITKPQNVYVMRDVMCSGYVAGGNTRFFGQPRGGTFGGPATPIDVTDALDKRLSFQNDAEGEYDSMLAFACGYGDGAKRDQVISITDRLLPWEVARSGGAQKDYFPGGDSNYQEYKKAFRLNTIHFGEDVRAAENMEFISQVPPEFNTSCAHMLPDSVASTDAHLYVVCRAP